MRLILTLFALLAVASATSIQYASACEEVEYMRESGEYAENPEEFKRLVNECIRIIDKILNVDDWEGRLSGRVSNLLLNYGFYYNDYDDQPLTYEERMYAESALEEGKWTEYLWGITIGGNDPLDFVDAVMECSTSGYGTERIKKSIYRDASGLAQVFESEKPLLRIRREYLQVDLDSRRRSQRLATKKRKQAEAGLTA